MAIFLALLAARAGARAFGPRQPYDDGTDALGGLVGFALLLLVLLVLAAALVLWAPVALYRRVAR